MELTQIPTRTLTSGARIPVIGLGTFGSDKYSGEQVADAVLGAAEVGYRHFDCAAVYGNEALIGRSLEQIQRSGVSRSELWITSKLWNDRHDDATAACEQSLRDLRVDYLDLYLIHWPFPNHHLPQVSVSSRDPNAQPYDHNRYMHIWSQLEDLHRRGLVRHIGTSNMTIRKLKLLLRDAEISPAANEMELHPHFQQPELFEYVVRNGILPIGYSPLGSPSRPGRDRTPEDTVDTEDPVILEIASRRNISPAAVCLKWAIQRGQVPIPFSVKRHQYFESLQAAVSEPLTELEMAEITGVDRNCRLIKGQVFLWNGAADWEEIWDEHQSPKKV